MPRSTSKTPGKSSVRSDLEAILSNRTDGASVIESDIFSLFGSIAHSKRPLPSVRLREISGKLRSRFCSMANIQNLLSSLATGSGIIAMLDSLDRYRHFISQNREDTIITAARKIARYQSILTLSNSETIRRAIMEAKKRGWNGRVFLAESRPRNEGAILAGALAKAGLPVTLSVDTLIPELIERSKAVFLGADAVTPSYFVNKIGSRIAVEFADRLGKPVYVAGDRGKLISNKDYEFVPDSNPSLEIVRLRDKRLRVENRYFEKIIPSGRFNYICGSRLYKPAEIKNILKRKI